MPPPTIATRSGFVLVATRIVPRFPIWLVTLHETNTL
jgi:hypothetical protein